MKFPFFKFGTFGKAINPFSFPNNDSACNVDVDFDVLKQELSVLPDLICAGRQIHGDSVEVVFTDNMSVFSGMTHKQELIKVLRFQNTDALITDEKNILLLNYTADCLPVFIFDPVRKCIGLVHSGWRGTAKKIVSKTCMKMHDVFGSKFENMNIYVGPHIMSCCYQLQTDHLDKKNAFLSYNGAIINQTNKEYLDLSVVLKADLIECGLRSEQVKFAKICTACRVDEHASHYIEAEKRTAFNWNYLLFV